MAFLWLGIYLGLRAKSPEMANGIYGLLYPVTMISNAFAPPKLIPSVARRRRVVEPAAWTTTAVRDLFGNPGGNPAGWLGEHSIGLAVVWPLVVTALTLTSRSRPTGGWAGERWPAPLCSSGTLTGDHLAAYVA